MPNLQGASPVGRDDGGHLYEARQSAEVGRVYDRQGRLVVLKGGPDSCDREPETGAGRQGACTRGRQDVRGWG